MAANTLRRRAGRRGVVKTTTLMMCSVSAVEAWCQTHPGDGARAIDARLTHVPATIQPPREAGLAQESTR